MLPDTQDKLKHYEMLLKQWQKTINLVSPATLDHAWDRHFKDSIQLNQYIPENTKILCDIGSGAGFPGLVLAILNPEIEIHLIESDTRKCGFLRNVSRETNCKNVTIHNGRIEAKLDDISDFDCLTARALASLKDLIGFTRQADQGFKMILPKGRDYHNEISEAQIYYNFDFSEHPSVIDKESVILIVSNVSQK